MLGCPGCCKHHAYLSYGGAYTGIPVIRETYSGQERQRNCWFHPSNKNSTNLFQESSSRPTFFGWLAANSTSSRFSTKPHTSRWFFCMLAYHFFGLGASGGEVNWLEIYIHPLLAFQRFKKSFFYLRKRVCFNKEKDV